MQFYTPTIVGGAAAPPSGPAPALPSAPTPAERQAQCDAKAAELEALAAKMTQHVALASSRMTAEFIDLAAESAEQMNAMLYRTSQFSEVILQSAAFAEYEVEGAVKEAMKILQNVQEIHRRTEAAQRLLVEAKGVGMSLGALEAMLTDMEMRRGMPVSGGLPEARR